MAICLTTNEHKMTITRQPLTLKSEQERERAKKNQHEEENIETRITLCMLVNARIGQTKVSNDSALSE